jgi:hypothetical protein
VSRQSKSVKDFGRLSNTESKKSKIKKSQEALHNAFEIDFEAQVFSMDFSQRKYSGFRN